MIDTKGCVSDLGIAGHFVIVVIYYAYYVRSDGYYLDPLTSNNQQATSNKQQAKSNQI
jgi:hypothetical protein